MVSVAFVELGKEGGLRIQLKTKKSFEFPHRFLENSEQRPKFERQGFQYKHGALERAKVSECQENKKLRGREQTLQLQITEQERISK